MRHGQDIVTVWDQDDPGSDIFLQAALSLARALSTRPGNGTDPSADFRAIEAGRWTGTGIAYPIG